MRIDNPFLCALVAGLVLSTPTASSQAQTFPNRPITLVSPYQAGGGADVMARAIAEAAARELGQPVVVEPKPGAEGLLGSTDVAKAAPDGYRLLWGGSGSLVVGSVIRKAPPYDPVTSFTPIAASVDYSSYLYVHPSFPAKTMKEFVDYVRANPGKVSYATGHNQGMLQMADLAHKYKLDMVRVQYRGEPAASTDLLTDRVQAIFATSSLMPFVKDGKLRLMATSLYKRSDLAPEVPTLTEAGTPAAPFGGGWLGIFGPPNMPGPIVERLTKAFTAAMSDPAVKVKMDAAGLVYKPYATADELSKYVRDQTEMYRKAIRELSIPLE